MAVRLKMISQKLLAISLLFLGSLAQINQEALANWFSGMNPSKVAYAVNCGSIEEVTDLNGVTFVADENFVGGVQSEEGKFHQWILPNSDVYHTERYGMNENFKYNIPIEQDGEYTLVLKFSEVYFTQPGQKVFDVKVGNKYIAKKVDVVGKLFSKYLPLDLFISVKQEKGKLYIDGDEVSGGIKNKKMQIEFMVGQADNPKINAIALVRGGKENTHYSSFKTYMNELDNLRKYQQEQAQENAESNKPFYSSDFFLEEDDILPTGSSQSVANSFLSAPWALEVSSLAFVVVFFKALSFI